jgi:hypothetical protein
VDLDVGVHRLLDEGDDIGGRNPRRAETRGDVGRAQVGRLTRLQRRDIALEDRIERGRGFRGLQLVADGPER